MGSAIASSGALTAYSGAKTGRSPSDKRIVKEESSESDIWYVCVFLFFSHANMTTGLQVAQVGTRKQTHGARGKKCVSLFPISVYRLQRSLSHLSEFLSLARTSPTSPIHHTPHPHVPRHATWRSSTSAKANLVMVHDLRHNESPILPFRSHSGQRSPLRVCLHAWRKYRGNDRLPNLDLSMPMLGQIPVRGVIREFAEICGTTLPRQASYPPQWAQLAGDRIELLHLCPTFHMPMTCQ